MRLIGLALVAALAGSLLPACSTGATGRFLTPTALLYLGPRANALIQLDYSPAVRTTTTVPGNARKVRITVKDPAGHIVGGIVFRDIPGDSTLNLEGLPASTELRFDATIADQAATELGRGKKRQQLSPGSGNAIPIPIFMNAGDLSTGNTNSSAQTANVNRISTRVTFAAGDRFRVRPVVSALNSAGSPVSCSPTYTIRSGYESADDHGMSSVNTSMFAFNTEAGIFNVEVDFTPNCGPAATQITRKIEFEKLATLVVPVN